MTEKKTRNSNIELLRIVAMLMIIVYHINQHCVRTNLITSPLFCEPLIYKSLLIPQLIEPLGIIGNGVFILISGFFMVKSRNGGVLISPKYQ